MRRYKAKSKRKFLYLLDNREYITMRNGDTTSSPQVPTLYIYIDWKGQGQSQSYHTLQTSPFAV